MPMIATLSRIPFAMSRLSGHRDGLPEVSPEAPAVVHVLYAEDHAHLLPHADAALEIRDLHQQVAALGEGHVAIDEGRRRRIGLPVLGEGLDAADAVREGIILLRVDGAAFDAGPRFRELVHAAGRAMAAHEARHRLTLAEEGGESGAIVALRPHAPVEPDLAAEGQEAQVIVVRLPGFDGGRRTAVPHLVRHLEDKGVHPLAESDDEDPRSGLR